MRGFQRILVAAILVFLGFGVTVASATEPPGVASGWAAKVDPWVLRTAQQGTTEFLVFLRQQAEVSVAAELPTKEKGQFVVDALTSMARVSQGPILARLAELGVEHRPYWIANMVWVRGGIDVVRAMAEREDVLKVFANPKVKQLLRPRRDEVTPPGSPDTVEWNITKVRAPDVWALGYNGQGAVTSGGDTGVQWDHPALKSHYRGWNGSTADHNYNWHDSIHDSTGNPCGNDSQVPCDDYGHGTHTMGTMVGDDGAGNQVGMAPGAKWIACRNMDQGAGTPARYTECFQFFIAPTDLSGNNPDPTKAPHVINNSWGCTTGEGCTDPTILQTIVENTTAAGIVVVVSAGNSGSDCSTVTDPPAIYEASLTVGATDSSDDIAGFSSRGPVTVDGSGRLKPDVSAPGVSVRSCVPPNSWATWDGTSMAGPHVAGEVALLLSAAPSLKGQVEAVKTVVTQSAVPETSSQTCGGVPGSQIPNNTFGWGRIDAYQAVNSNIVDLALTKTAGPNPVLVGQNLTYTLVVRNVGPATAANVLVTDPLPASLSFVSASNGCSNSSGTVTCFVPTLAGGGSATFTIVTTPTAEGTIVNTAHAPWPNDPTPADNDATATVIATTQSADLSIGISAAPNPVFLSASLVYTLTVTNGGPEDATGVLATDTLPSTLTFVSASANCSNASGTVTCSLGTVANGATANATITVTPTALGSVSNSASVMSDAGDPNPANNSASIAVPVVLMTADAMSVDAHSAPLTSSNLNGVLEPGEQVMIAPSWTNPTGASVSFTGTAAGFSGPGGSYYSILDNSAAYGTVAPGATSNCFSATGNCFIFGVSNPPTRPAQHWDATFTETLTAGGWRVRLVHVGNSFADVPPTRWAYSYIETMLHKNITAGCGNGNYCPGIGTSRWQMAVFLSIALAGNNVPTSGTVPGMGDYNCVSGGQSVFGDVAPTDSGCKFIHYIAAKGITSGCGDGDYCPSLTVDRWQMAVFVAKAIATGPIPVSGTIPGLGAYDCEAGGESVFGDVAPTDGGCKYIHYIAANGITAGCGGGNYCPSTTLNRDQMAVFITKAFNFNLYGP
jgi:serine protease AprX